MSTPHARVRFDVQDNEVTFVTKIRIGEKELSVLSLIPGVTDVGCNILTGRQNNYDLYVCIAGHVDFDETARAVTKQIEWWAKERLSEEQYYRNCIEFLCED